MPESQPLVAGVDEAGRGPLAGPVVVAAVILAADRPIPGLADSKRLSARRREALAIQIRDHARACAVVVVEAARIDQINILEATLEGMREAVLALNPLPALARIDGNRAPALPIASETLVGGDALDPAISAASILAKTHRDALMLALHARYPVYGFDRHKGYPTRDHLAALQRHGPCPAHRQSFRPVVQAGLFD